MVFSFIFKFMIHFELIFVYDLKYGLKFIFFAYRYPKALEQFVEKTIPFSLELPIHC